MSLRKNQTPLYTILVSVLIGFVTALTVVTMLYQNDLNSAFDWIVTLSLFTLGFGYLYSISLPGAWQRFRTASQPVKLWGVLLAVVSAYIFIFDFGVLLFVPLLFICFILAAPGFQSLQNIIEQKRTSSYLLAWALGGTISFFGVGFFKNFHPTVWEFILITVLLNIVTTLICGLIVERLAISLKDKLLNKIVAIVVILLGLALLL